MRKIFISPAKMLMGAVLDELRLRIRDNSLSHILIITPSRRAGRRLAHFLGEAGRTLRVKEPFEVVSGGAVSSTEAEITAAFIDFLASHDASRAWPHLFLEKRLPGDMAIQFHRQLSDIWRALAGGGLSMQDVCQRLSSAPAPGVPQTEIERWRELAALETSFFAHLQAKNLIHPATISRRARLGIDQPPLEDGIEEIILPALVDPVSTLFDVLSRYEAANPRLVVTALVHAYENESALFDDFARPLSGAWFGPEAPKIGMLEDSHIVSTASPRELAQSLAASWCAKNEPVAIGLADQDMYGDIEAAFLDRSLLVYNPQMFRLAASSLGQIAINLVAVRTSSGIPMRAFAALMRSDDVLSAASAATGLPSGAILAEMEKYSNETLARVFDPSHPHLSSGRFPAFEKAARLVAEWLAEKPGAPFGEAARAFFAHIAPAPGSGEATSASKEFAAAQEALANVLAALDTPSVRSLPPDDFAQLGRLSLANASYSLEAPPEAVRTLGWLELAWSDSPYLAIAGLHEGKVPESLIGHPFLPDSLRTALGIADNARRLARDAFLFREIVACRKRGAVEVFVSRVSTAGDILKPSRLLFAVNDATLVRRARHLFSPPPSPSSSPRSPLPDSTILQFRDFVDFPNKNATSPGSISPSSIDAYLRCPFTWYLCYGENLRRNDPRTRLEKNDFGTIAHAILEDFAKNEIAWANAHNGIAHTSEDDIRRLLEESFLRQTAQFSLAGGAVKLQLESIRERILDFAPIQAFWAQDNWRPYAAEMRLKDSSRKEKGKVYLFGPSLPYINGSIDRVDFHPVHGFRVIDYKTWDSATPDGLKKHVFASGSEEIALAESFGYPVFKPAPRMKGLRRFLTVQTQLYAKTLELARPGVFGGKVNDACYLILGSNPGNVRVWGSRHETPFDAEEGPTRIILMDFADKAFETARRAVESMANGVFWPPAPSDAWRRDYASLFKFSPERDIDPAWIERHTVHR